MTVDDDSSVPKRAQARDALPGNGAAETIDCGGRPQSDGQSTSTSDQTPSAEQVLTGCVQRLEQEVDQLRRALASRGLTAQASGLLAAWLQIRPSQGWEVLRVISNQTNVPAREVARLLVDLSENAAMKRDEDSVLRPVLDALRSDRVRRIVEAAHSRAEESTVEKLLARTGTAAGRKTSSVERIQRRSKA
jgi:hypothetical protein